MNIIFLFNITSYSFTGIDSIQQSLISAIPQFGSPITPFHISPFHSFQSTFTFIHISLFYYILLSSLHSYSILLNTITGISFSSFISYFHLYLHSHIISILFISHNSSSSLSFSSPTTSICYDFVRIVSVVFKYPFYHLYDCC